MILLTQPPRPKIAHHLPPQPAPAPHKARQQKLALLLAQGVPLAEALAQVEPKRSLAPPNHSRGSSRRCITRDGVAHPNIHAAARHLGVSDATARDRVIFY